MRLFRSAVVLCVTALVGFTGEAQDRQVSAEIRTVKVRERLTKAKSASAEAWEDVKAGVGSALDDLQSAFERARARFK